MDSFSTAPGLALICFLITSFLFNSVSSWTPPVDSESLPSYKDHCASFVPESTPKNSVFNASYATYKGYSLTGAHGFLGGQSSRHRESYYLRVLAVYETDDPGLFKTGGSLRVRTTSVYYGGNYTQSLPSVYYPGQSYHRRNRINHVSFSISGFWSKSSGKLCMVGSGRTSSRYNFVNANVVLKLHNVTSSQNITTSLISGTLDSLDSVDNINHFESISLLMLPTSNYNFSMVSEAAFDHSPVEDDFAAGLSFSSMPLKSFCSFCVRLINEFRLEYSSDCNSAKKCSPFGGSFMPYIMNFDMIACSEFPKRLRVVVRFWNRSYNSYEYQPFNPSTSLVGEGWWDYKKNQLSIVACRFLGSKQSSAYVGDCSIRVSLRLPAIWTINETSNIVGSIWSAKNVADSGYFKRIMFRSSEMLVEGAPVKYEYTKIDRVRKLCPVEKQVKHNGEYYPYPNSYEMRFDMSVKSSERVIAWGYSTPVSVGNRLIKSSTYTISNSSFDTFWVNRTLFNISYNIGITSIDMNSTSSSWNLAFNTTSDISAEGIYDAENGRLCMVGCRKLGINSDFPTSHSEDCEMLIKFQFSPVNAKENAGYIEGSVESTRNKGDPLHFQALQLSSVAYSVAVASDTLVRIDAELIMVLVSTTLYCIFLGLQLYHIRKHPDVLPLISVFMLSILTSGHMIPLVLNFEAFFTKNTNQNMVLLGGSGWLEVQEITVRLLMMVAFLLEFRLLQLTWSARKADGKKNTLWSAEKKAVYVTLPLYATGVVIAVLTNWMKKNAHDYQEHTYWEDLKSYGGLVLDGFLLPQIMFNLVLNLKENVLTGLFYFGTTIVRLLPHVYDLYRIHSYNSHKDVSLSDIYADHSADLYSTSWDVVITLGGCLFAMFVFLQQRMGGLCLVPWRFKASQVYEKVPTTSEA